MRRNPRISVALKPSVLETVQRMSTATGQSMSAIVGELLEMVEPIMARVAALKELAEKADRESRAGLIESLQRGQDDLEPVVLKALEVLGIAMAKESSAEAGTASAHSREAPRAALRAIGGAVNPRIVTRGSGRESSTSEAKTGRGLKREGRR